MKVSVTITVHKRKFYQIRKKSYKIKYTTVLRTPLDLHITHIVCQKLRNDCIVIPMVNQSTEVLSQ